MKTANAEKKMLEAQKLLAEAGEEKVIWTWSTPVCGYLMSHLTGQESDVRSRGAVCPWDWARWGGEGCPVGRELQAQAGDWEVEGCSCRHVHGRWEWESACHLIVLTLGVDFIFIPYSQLILTPRWKVLFQFVHSYVDFFCLTQLNCLYTAIFMFMSDKLNKEKNIQSGGFLTTLQISSITNDFFKFWIGGKMELVSKIRHYLFRFPEK